MTASTQGLTSQGLAASGIGSQQPFGPGFPQAMGTEQLGGIPPYGIMPTWLAQTQPMTQMPQGVQAPFGGQSPFGGQTQFGGQSPFAGQAQFGAQWPYGQPWTQQVPPVVQQLAAQILPIAQQVILPQVIIAAIQQIQQHVTQLVAQFATSQAAITQGQTWLPFSPQYGTGLFAQAGRPLSYLS